MTKFIVTGLISLCLFNIVAHADPVTRQKDTFDYKPEVGLGIGGVIGALIGGPPGAILGMAGGLWMGGNDEKKDETITDLNDDLLKQKTELTIMENRFTEMQDQYVNELQKVSLNNRTSSLKDLSKGISLAVYFRTDSSEIEPDSLPRIQKLAGFLKQFPEIKLLVEGYADKRGASDFNRELGEKRARAVEDKLIQAGITKSRILTHSYGESRAQSKESDLDGTVFDRKVRITLTVDTRI